MTDPSLRLLAAEAVKRNLAAALDQVVRFDLGYNKHDLLRAVALLQAEAGDFPAARATMMEHTDFAARTLGEIAAAQIRAGDTAGAAATLALTARSPACDRALDAVVAAQAQAGDLAGAAATMAMLEPAHDLAFPIVRARREIAAAFARAGDLGRAKQELLQARDVMRRVEPRDERDSQPDFALMEIALAQAKLGDFPAAKETVTWMNGGFTCGDQALEKIAVMQARTGDRAGARETVELLKGYLGRPYWLSKVTRAQARIGDFAAARAAVINSEWDHAWRYLSLIAVEQAKAGDFAGAKATAGEISESMMTTDARAMEEKPRAMREISAAQAQEEKPRAMREIAAVQAREEKTKALREIAAAQARAGDAAGAKLTFDEAKATAAKLQPGGSRERKLIEIASAQARAGDAAGAKLTFDEARATAAELQPDSLREPWLFQIALARARAGDAAEAKAETAMITRANVQYLQDLAAALVWQEGIAAAEAWASTFTAPRERYFACLGVAEAAGRSRTEETGDED